MKHNVYITYAKQAAVSLQALTGLFALSLQYACNIRMENISFCLTCLFCAMKKKFTWNEG